MYQKLIVVGNLGGDPEIRYLDNKQAVCSFSLATSRKWHNARDELIEETTWFRVSVWGKRAETASQYLSKGSKVLVEGRLTPDKETGGPRLWTRQDGTPAASFEITADNFSFVGSRQDNEGGDDQQLPQGKAVAYTESGQATVVDADDIPF